MSVTWVVLQHLPQAHPGLVLVEGAGRGIAWDVRRRDLGDPPPASGDAVDGLIVLGDGGAVEHELLRAAAADGRPLLALGAGARALAVALGAQPAQGPAAGAGTVAPSADGRADAVLGAAGDELAVLFTGDEGATAAPRTTALAANGDRVLAFRAGPRAYGLHFHAECDRRLASQLELWSDFRLPAGAAERIEASGRAVLRAFYGACGVP